MWWVSGMLFSLNNVSPRKVGKRCGFGAGKTGLESRFQVLGCVIAYKLLHSAESQLPRL